MNTTTHDGRCENRPGGEYHGKTIGGRGIPCHCPARAEGRRLAQEDMRRAGAGYPVDMGGPTCPQHGAPLDLAQVVRFGEATIWHCPAGDNWRRPAGGYLYPLAP